MFDINFLPQIEASKRHLGLNKPLEFDAEETPRQNRSSQYILPKDIKVLPCYQDINGEYVPYPVSDKKETTR